MRDWDAEKRNVHARRWPVPLAGVLLIVTLLVPHQAVAEEKTPTRELRPTMHAFFQALIRVFPWSLDEQPGQAPAPRPGVQEALRALADNAAGLEMHGQDLPQSYHFLRRSLAESAQKAAQRYAQGEYRGARVVLRQLTENCFACHARFTDPQAFDLGQRFFAATPMEHLSTKDRVRLAVATRQFGTALEMCEALFRSETLNAAAIGVLGVFEDYLKIVLRVRGDFPRAITAFERFLQRPDVPLYLRDHLTSWVAALKELQPQGLSGEGLPRARALIEAGQRRNRFQADYLGLVHFVVASSLLHRYIDTRPTDTGALAEAYYLLGIAESYVSRTSWVAETPFLLEMAIRLAPRSATSAMAYDVLNAYMVSEHTGSSGVHIPPEVQDHLDALRRLR